MKLVLIDLNWKKLLPLTFAKPVSELLVGIDKIGEKWDVFSGEKHSYITAGYLQEKFAWDSEGEQVLVNSSAIPTKKLTNAINSLEQNQVLTYRGKFIAGKFAEIDGEKLAGNIETGQDIPLLMDGSEEVLYNDDLILVESPADIFTYNGAIFDEDYDRITKKYNTTDLPSDVISKGDKIFIEEGAVVNHCVLNASTGPIYIGKNAEVMEGCLIRGPFSLGEHSTLKMGAKVYGPTSIGKHCKVGGEIGNSIVNDYSNKGHDGYLGNSVIGSWCNLGADTNTSNLKNNYAKIRVWSYETENLVDTGRQFHGLIMGDYSKAGINTMFNTGTIMGMCANVFDGGFPPKFIPSFSWGSVKTGFMDFNMEKAHEAADAMMIRREQKLSEPDKRIFAYVYNNDAKYRSGN